MLELIDRMHVEQTSWNCLEALMERIPANYLLVSYLLSILLFAVYYLFSWRVISFHWLISTEHVLLYDMRYISQSLAQSILVPYLIAGLIYLTGKTKDMFRYLDLLHCDPQNEYFDRIQARVTGAIGYHLLLFLSVVVPFIMISYGQWDYHRREDGYWAWGLDIYSYLLSFLILALLTELLWLMANIVWSINEIGYMADVFSESADVYGMGMKLRPLRNFFLIFIVYYFVAIALIIYTYLSPSHKISLEPIYFSVLLAVGAILFVAGLEAIQRIINFRVEIELDSLNRRHAEQDNRLKDVVLSKETNKASEIDCISKVLDIIRKDRESLLQVKRRAYDVASVVLFISSFLIPLLTMLEKLGLLHK